jgi:hypothetical protein
MTFARARIANGTNTAAWNGGPMTPAPTPLSE